MQDKSKFIPGIYNYCDRWCERCTFASRRMNYERNTDLTPEEQDIHSRTFWDHIRKNFDEAFQLLHKAAKEHSIDLNDISKKELDEHSRKEKKDRKETGKHPLALITKEYIKKGKHLLENTTALEEKANGMIRNFEMGIQNEEEAKKEASIIKDCQEIIHWYLHFIHVKFMRAIMGKIEDDGWEKENGFQKDSDGSAKIALIGIDRSMEAWTTLLQFLPDIQDDIIVLLALLQKSKRLGEAEFPNARKFIRPGFDEV
jgi:hypothetical protein